MHKPQPKRTGPILLLLAQNVTMLEYITVTNNKLVLDYIVSTCSGKLVSLANFHIFCIFQKFHREKHMLALDKTCSDYTSRQLFHLGISTNDNHIMS
jgi:hypothetical protein